MTTGDFKFDLTPIGPMADIHKMAMLGSKGVKLLLSDSTNALSDGFSKSESSVDEALGNIFSKINSRIIIATFASNIYRIKHIVETCRKNNRKIITFGRSMENAKEIALKNNLIKDSNIFIDANEAKGLKKNEICILCTGSQGEPLAALSRIANGTHKQIQLLPDDVVVFSSSPIPGNRASINKIINKLYLKGVKVYTNTELADIHTSGHAKGEELKWMLRIIKPEYFMPVHGEYRHLKHHGDLAVDMGMPRKNVFILETGQVLELTKDSCKKDGKVRAGAVYVDGLGVGDVGNIVLKDRRNLAQDGMVIIVVTIEKDTLSIVSGPDIVTRGFVYVKESEELIKVVKSLATEELTKCLDKEIIEWYVLKGNVKRSVENYIYDRTKRRPTIIPIIMEV